VANGRHRRANPIVAAAAIVLFVDTGSRTPSQVVVICGHDGTVIDEFQVFDGAEAIATVDGLYSPQLPILGPFYAHVAVC
jgi:hypothetical protein